MSGTLINVTPRADPRDGVFDAVREPVTYHLVEEQALPAVRSRGSGFLAAAMRPVVGAGKFLGASGVAFCVMLFNLVAGFGMVISLIIAAGYGVMGLITKVNTMGHVALFFGCAFACFVAIGLASLFDQWVSRLAGFERR